MLRKHLHLANHTLHRYPLHHHPLRCRLLCLHSPGIPSQRYARVHQFRRFFRIRWLGEPLFRTCKPLVPISLWRIPFPPRKLTKIVGASSAEGASLKCNALIVHPMRQLWFKFVLWIPLGIVTIIIRQPFLQILKHVLPLVIINVPRPLRKLSKSFSANLRKMPLPEILTLIVHLFSQLGFRNGLWVLFRVAASMGVKKCLQLLEHVIPRCTTRAARSLPLHAREQRLPAQHRTHPRKNACVLKPLFSTETSLISQSWSSTIAPTTANTIYNNMVIATTMINTAATPSTDYPLTVNVK